MNRAYCEDEACNFFNLHGVWMTDFEFDPAISPLEYTVTVR